MANFGVTENGFVMPTFNDIVASMESKFKKKVGDDWVMDQYTPEGAIFYTVAAEFSKNWRATKAAYDSDFLDLCEGIQLDYKGKEEDNLFRSQGKYSNTNLRFVTDKELTIPAGTLVKKVDTDLLFRTTVSLDIDASFVGDVRAISTETGSEYNSAIGQLNELSTGIIGVVSVSNIEPATGGEGIEPDFKYRPRIKFAKRVKGGSTVDSITSELNKLAIVNNSLILENIGDAVDGDGVGPGQIKIFIDGTDDILIAETIHKFKADGIKSIGNIAYNVTNIGGQEIEERFSLLEKKQLYVKVTVDIIAGTLTHDIKKQVKENIIKYVEEIQVGDIDGRINEIIINQLSTQAYNANDSIKKLTTSAALTPSPTAKIDIPIPVGQYFYCDESTIEVV